MVCAFKCTENDVLSEVHVPENVVARLYQDDSYYGDSLIIVGE